jgi:hypothetical protein
MFDQRRSDWLGMASRPEPRRRIHEALQAGQDRRALLCF